MKPHGNSYQNLHFQHMGAGNIQLRYNNTSKLLKKADPFTLQKILKKVRPKMNGQSYISFAKEVFSTPKGMSASCKTSHLEYLDSINEGADMADTSRLADLARKAGKSVSSIIPDWESAIEITQEIFGKSSDFFNPREWDYTFQTLSNTLGIKESSNSLPPGLVEEFLDSGKSLQEFLNCRVEVIDFMEEEDCSVGADIPPAKDETLQSAAFSIGEPGGIKKKKKKD